MSSEMEHLRYMLAWPKAFLPWTFDEPLDEYHQRAEQARLRGDFGLDWMLNGFPEQRGSNP